MTNTVLIFKDVHGEEIHIMAGAITNYHQTGAFTTIYVLDRREPINVHHPIEEVVATLQESLYMIKRVGAIGIINEI